MSFRYLRKSRGFRPVVEAVTVAGLGMVLTASTLAQVRATVTESEVNSYLAYELGSDLPTGVVQPSVSALGTGRVSGRAVVDLDAVRKAGGNSGGLFDLRSYLTGQVPVTATGVLRTSNGHARLELQSASVAGVPVPKLLLQEIVSYYSRS